MAILSEAPVTTRGICSACIHEAACIYARSAAQIVLNCGQFEPCPPRAPEPADQDRAELAALWGLPADEESSHYPGLCVNCEDRHICRYPKPAGGVWQCGEYR